MARLDKIWAHFGKIWLEKRALSTSRLAALTLATPIVTGLGLTGLTITGFGVVGFATQAQAQVTSPCEQGRKLFQERQNLMSKINSWQKKKVDPAVACNVLSQLQANGSRALAWADVNKDWCQVPDQAIDGLRTQQSQVAGSRGNACKAAAAYSKALSAARKQQAQQRAAQQQGNVGFGGVDDFSGAPRPIPQGAL